MKTGISLNKRTLSEPFSISLLGLEALLKRYGFKDCVLFKNHNPHYIMNEDLFESGICFNLFSEYGVGKKLEPLISDLLKNNIIDSDKNKDNIFFQEIVRLSNTIIILIREGDSIKETDWTYKYAIENLNTVDKLSSERLERIIDLFDVLPNDDVDLLDESIEDDLFEYCNCNFCNEFHKYHIPRDKHINEIIFDVLLEIW